MMRFQGEGGVSAADIGTFVSIVHRGFLVQTMKHINSTFVNYIKNTNELQAVLQSDFSSFQVRLLLLTIRVTSFGQH